MMKNLSQKERVIVGGLAALVALYFVLHAMTLPAGVKPSLVIGGVITGLMALGHAWYMLGWKRALAFFLISAVISFLAESVSIATCSVTCYHYTDALGPILGNVPIIIPISWFSMIYASFVVINIVTEGQPISTRGNNSWVLWLALATALVMTAWDLTLDPYMVQLEHAWVWDPGGTAPRYFEIPFANYVGWVQTVFIIVVTYRFVERNLPLEPVGKVTPFVAMLPVLMYAINGLSDVLVGYPEATRVLSPFTMGIAILVALVRVVQMRDPLVPLPAAIAVIETELDQPEAVPVPVP
jgi:uncharacterized membrane protein